MFKDAELTENEARKADAMAGTVMAGLFRFGAKLLKGTGVTVKYATKGVGTVVGVTGAALMTGGLIVEEGGEKFNGYCQDKAGTWEDSADEIDPPETENETEPEVAVESAEEIAAREELERMIDGEVAFGI